ncbi:MAG: type III-B CRISPR module RAMP protein Cmr6, partial [Saprospiraceae bacterium]|nr:type III-B CRISPR module RAMP protein Cmr6 [Saprospiraceae bacterium]
FFFDFTSGLPIIPGSSVKGVLRSVFYQEPFFIALIKDLFNADISKEQVKKMATEIFGPAPKEHVPAAQSTSPVSRDIFYDAVPEKSYHKSLPPANGNLLANDFITPHINRKNPAMGPFTNPVPIQFLKVLPEVVFRFQFDFKSSEDFSFLNVEGKKKLFKEILLTLGIGAKTNVGYGQFVEV